MRKRFLSDLKGTEKLAKTIYNEDGRVLLNPGIVLTNNYISKMDERGVNIVYVEDEISEGVEFEDYLSDKIRQKCKKDIRESINKYLQTGKEDYDTLIECSQIILDDIMSNKGVILNMDDSRAKNEGLVPHIINVTAIVAIVGKKMGYNVMKLKDIVTGAILHDVGKIAMLRDKNLTLNKINLIEEKTMNEHPKRGYEMLNKLWSFSSVSKIMILMHHENSDGSGYPMAMKKKDIHEGARLLRICDAFDNMMIGNSESKKPIPFNQIIDYLKFMDKYFDQEIVSILEKVIPPYPSGTVVELSTEERAVIYKQNLIDLKYPIVRAFCDKNNKYYKQSKEIDLNLNKDIKIKKVLEKVLEKV
ncbi:MAG: HD domain-containing phosphohydrolase [Clostridiales bacterium]